MVHDIYIVGITLKTSDLALEAIRDRFDQDGYHSLHKRICKMFYYRNRARGSACDLELKAILDFYGSDFSQF